MAGRTVNLNPQRCHRRHDRSRRRHELDQADRRRDRAGPNLTEGQAPPPPAQPLGAQTAALRERIEAQSAALQILEDLCRVLRPPPLLCQPARPLHAHLHCGGDDLFSGDHAFGWGSGGAYPAKTPKLRAGHTKRKRAAHSGGQAIDVQPLDIQQSPNPHGAGEHLARQLIDEPAEPGHDIAVKALLGFVSNNADRMNYPAYQLAGIQIGSGAMESLHRTASQMRCKIPGARWLPDSAVATIRMRLLTLVERWDDFWRSPDLTSNLCQAFSPEITMASA